MLHERYAAAKKEQEKLLVRKNLADETFYNGVTTRYVYPVLTRDHVFTTLDEMMDYIRENSVVTEEEAAEGKR